ncbi:MAG: peptidoglycan bridge formation glycyltransferase FemA/FemB family protein [Candidatus Moranbacteria bacterium]|nr:peptidoglycan bridge formation glycyltransferase FemA/FemB family protein [Candidatus Moranbacteria bacterium]
MNFSLKPVSNKLEQTVFESFFVSKQFQAGKFLQSLAWAEFLNQHGQETIKLLIRDQNRKIIGKILVIIAKNAGFRYAYCPYGPIMPWQKFQPNEIKKLFELIINFLKKQNCIFLKINPPVLAKNRNLVQKISNLKLSKSQTNQPAQTLYLNLRQPTDLLLKNMKSKTRYNIRLAQRKNLKINSQVNQDNFNNFYKIAQTTAQRNQFKLHQKTYYQDMFEVLAKANILKIYSALYQKKVIASILVIHYQNTATYLHGASSNQNRNLMAPYLLQFHAINQAQRANLFFYDFWGIDQKKWPGVTRFKIGFGGQIIQYLPTYEIKINNRLYPTYTLLRKLAGWKNKHFFNHKTRKS